MSEFSTKEVQLILDVMRDKGVNLNCPRCGHPNFDLTDGYYNLPQTKDDDSTEKTKTIVPAVIFYCKNCGFVTQHALRIVDLKKRNGELTLG